MTIIRKNIQRIQFHLKREDRQKVVGGGGIFDERVSAGSWQLAVGNGVSDF